jgi:hypothetical protein
MLTIFLTLFGLFALTGSVCLWCGRRSLDHDRHADRLRLLALTTDLHRATARLKRAVVANRPPSFTKESCYAIAHPRRPRS